MPTDLGHSQIFKRDDGIVQLNCSEHIYTLEDLKEIVKAHYLLNAGKKTLLLVIVHQYTDIEPEARKYMAEPESTDNSIAEAYVLRSVAQKLLANFYLKTNQPVVPSRFFTNKEEALRWLKSFES